MERPSLIAMDVVIVHYHAAAGVREAVEALRADARASDLPIHIVVADNGSTPDERALLDSLNVQPAETRVTRARSTPPFNTRVPTSSWS